MIPSLLSLLLTLASPRSHVLHATYTDRAPVLDGVLEPLWHQGDSAWGFTQMVPNEGEPATESTTVYLLYDAENLYIAFRCRSRVPVRAWVQPWDEAEGDAVGVGLDTFGDRRTAYSFQVNARGVQRDLILSADGRREDEDWNGIWFAEARIYDWGYVVEIRIPFKAIRYRKGLTTWGINFFRYINERAEKAFWAPMKRAEGIRISRFGELRGIRPGATGRFLELYPVGLYRQDRYRNSLEHRFHSGLDLGWSPGPQTALLLTVNPDFGEVEADPYKVNLSKFRLFYEEKRPFFLEGTEIFRVLSGGGWGARVRLFYSRNIGKRLPGGREVPIYAGFKGLHKSEHWEGGVILARTGAVRTEEAEEPAAFYGVLRIQRTFSGNSTVGLFAGAKEPEGGALPTRVGALDLHLRSAQAQLSLVWARALAHEGRNRPFSLDSSADLFSLNYDYDGDPWFWGARGIWVGRKFDISELGFVGYPGFWNGNLSGGLKLYPRRGLRFLRLGVSLWGLREAEESQNAYGLYLFSRAVFPSLWSIYFHGGLGKGFEQETAFLSRSFGTGVRSPENRNLRGGVNFGGDYDYNYRQGFFGWSLQGSLWLSNRITPSTEFSLQAQEIAELDPQGDIAATTWILRPRLSHSFTREVHLSLYGEMVSEGSSPAVHIDQFRIGGLLAWQLGPKSWFYLALNDLETGEETRWITQERISVIKLRYLLAF